MLTSPRLLCVLPACFALFGLKGQFGSGQLIHDLPDTGPVEQADIDGDGDLDLVMITNGHHLKWLSNNGSGAFGSAQQIVNAQNDIRFYTLCDKDLDGDLDVVFMEVDDQQVKLSVATISGQFDPPIAIHTVADEVGALTSGDITGDGYPELVLTTGSVEGPGITWLANTAGTFGNATVLQGLYPGVPSPFILAGDMDLVGGVDLVVRDTDGWLYALLNTTGDASVWNTQYLLTFPQYEYNAPHLFDVNVDGLLDVVGSGPTAVHWARNTLGEGGAWNPFSDQVLEPWLTGGPASFGRMGCGTGGAVVFVPNNPALPVRWTTWMPVLGNMAFSADLPDVPRGTSPLLMDVDGDDRDDLLLQLPEGLFWFPNLTQPSTTVMEIPAIDTLCLYGDPFPLPEASPAGGRWSGQWVIDNVFYRTNLFNGGNFTLGNTLYGPEGCPSAASTVVRVIAEPTIFPAVGEPICSGDGPVVLTSEPSNTTWSGLQSGNILDPATYTGNSIVCLFVDGTGAECVSIFNATVWTTLPAQIAAAGPFCITDGTQLITAAQGPPVGLVWSGDIVGYNSAGASFFPSQGAGTYEVVLVAEPTGPQQCAGSDTLLISVSDNIPEVSIDPLPAICAEGASFQLSGGFPEGGIWSGPGIANGFLDPNTILPGTSPVAYSYRAPEGCSTTAFAFIQLLDTVVLDSNAPDLQFCTVDGGVQFTAFPAGGSWNAPIGEDGIMEPALLSQGFYPILYTWNGPNGCVLENAPLTFEVLPETQVSINDVGVLCADGSAVAITGSLPGIWSGALNGEGESVLFDPSAFGVGNWVVTLTAEDAGLCPGTALSTIVVEICTDMEEGTPATQALLMPNPFNGQATLLLNTPGNAAVEVIEATGRKVQEFRTGGGSNAITIDLQDRANGTYLIRIGTANGVEVIRAVKVD
jgi:hypothetical protein